MSGHSWETLQARKHVLTKGPSPPAPWSWATGLRIHSHYLSHPSWYFAMATRPSQVSISTYTDIERAPEMYCKLFLKLKTYVPIQCKCKKENCWSNPYIFSAVSTSLTTQMLASSHLIREKVICCYKDHQGREKEPISFLFCDYSDQLLLHFLRPHLGFWHDDNFRQLITPTGSWGKS